MSTPDTALPASSTPAVTAEPDIAAPPPAVEDAVEVSLDLDALSKFDVVEDAVEELFVVRHRGHRFTLCDPRDLDWKDILQAIRNPVQFMRYAIPQDQQDLFYSLRLEAWKINVLMEHWHQHYKMPHQQDIAKLISG